HGREHLGLALRQWRRLETPDPGAALHRREEPAAVRPHDLAADLLVLLIRAARGGNRDPRPADHEKVTHAAPTASSIPVAPPRRARRIISRSILSTSVG